MLTRLTPAKRPSVPPAIALALSNLFALINLYYRAHQ